MIIVTKPIRRRRLLLLVLCSCLGLQTETASGLPHKRKNKNKNKNKNENENNIESSPEEGFLRASPATATATATATTDMANAPQPQPQPLQIFVMVGQSNTQGHGYMDSRDEATGAFLNGTLEWLVETQPETYGKLRKSNNDGDESHWTERDDVWISYNRQNSTTVRPEHNQHGKLKAGFGGDPGEEGHQMGPELGFGWTVGDALNKNNENKNRENNNKKNILLIKVAWGGKSLAVDFRPPSAGGTTGLYYEALLAAYWKSLAELHEIVPSRMLEGGFRLAGLAWHQGWNDGCNAAMTAEYETNLAHLIRDLRVDLGGGAGTAAEANTDTDTNTEANTDKDFPVVIGVSGMTGWQTEYPLRNEIAAAQLAVADYPEFSGTVATAETRSFFREAALSPGRQKYHWNNNCESYWLVGTAMGEAMVGLIQHRDKQKQTTREEGEEGANTGTGIGVDLPAALGNEPTTSNRFRRRSRSSSSNHR
eukprot:jgi/Psemu1/5357/gm1.5357_g